MRLSKNDGKNVMSVTESWRTNGGTQTTIGVIWKDDQAKAMLDPQYNGLESIDVFVPVVGQTPWEKVPMQYWGVHQASSGGDPSAGSDQFHVDIPDVLPSGNRVDLEKLKYDGFALRATLPRNDGTATDVWLQEGGPNYKVGGLY